MRSHTRTWITLVAIAVAVAVVVVVERDRHRADRAAAPSAATGVVAADLGDPLLSRAVQAFEPVPAVDVVLDERGITAAQVDLGRMLYLDPRLSASGLISCNSCHNLGLAGADLHETSVGHGWKQGPRNAPTVLNAVFHVAQFWDGRAADLEEQAKGPVQAGVEMHSTPERVTRTLASIPEYRIRFAAAFPQDPRPVSFENMARAIQAFEATLVTPGGRFDRFLAGDPGALTPVEREGLVLFMDRGCAGCHRGVAVGGNGYYRFGVVERPTAEILPPNDRGRFQVTRTVGDEYVFKVPSLRNVALTAPYFHSGRVWTLEQAVGIMGASQVGAALTDVEEARIAAFLRTLTGEQPRVEYPQLPPSAETTPRPDLRVN